MELHNYPHCSGCGKKLKDYRSKRCYFCNIKDRYKDKQVTKNCLNCQSPFTKAANIMRVQGCCSHQCGIDYWFKNHRGENHPHWKTDSKELGYSRMHAWIREEFGDAACCMIADSTCNGSFEWANTEHKNRPATFKRSEFVDFVPLCESHHVRFDRYKSI